MTATSITTDAETYAAYVVNGENKAATARILGIGASTVADRVKRHLARMTETAAEFEADAAADEAAYRDGQPENMTEDEAEAYLARITQDEASEPEVLDGEIKPEDTKIEGSTAHDHDGETEAGETTPAISETAAEDGKVTKCVDCGYQFTRPQSRRTCKVKAACERRQAAGDPTKGRRQDRPAA